MGALTGPQVARHASRAGITNPDALVMAVAIAFAESSWNPTKVNSTLNDNGTVDRGLWQINSVHKQYDPVKLLDPAYNAAAMFGVSNGGTNWTPWSSYKNNAYKAHLAKARAAVQQTGAIGIGAAASGSIDMGDDGLLGGAVDAAGRLIPGAAGAVGDLLGGAGDMLGDAAGGAASLLGLDGIAKDVFTAGLGLVFSLGALVLVALGLSRLTGRSPAKTLQESTADAKAAAGLLT